MLSQQHWAAGALTDFGCEHSFGHAAARVLEHYGFAMGPCAVRVAILAQAQRAREKLEAQHLEPPGTPEETAPVRNGHGHRYLTNRDYPRALKLGLPIGSGIIESAQRHVLQARLKKAGTAWLADHADRAAPSASFFYEPTAVLDNDGTVGSKKLASAMWQEICR